MGDRHVGIAPESTWGTLVAPTTYIEAQSVTGGNEREYDEINTVSARSTRSLVTAANKGALTILAPFNYQEIGEFLYYLYGGVDVTGGGPYTHTFPASTGLADRVAFSLETKKDSTALTWRWPGNILTALTITVPERGAATVEYTTINKGGQPIGITGTHDGSSNAATLSDSSANFVVNSMTGLTINNTTDGSSGTITANDKTTITATLSGGTDADWDSGDAYTITGVSSSPSFRDFDTANREHVTVSFDGGGTTFCGQSLTLAFQHDADETYCFGNINLGRKPADAAPLQVTLTVEALLEDMDEYAHFANDVDVDAVITFNHPTQDENLVVNIDKGRLTQADAPVEGRERLKTTYILRGQFNTTATDAAQCVLINDHADVTD